MCSTNQKTQVNVRIGGGKNGSIDTIQVEVTEKRRYTQRATIREGLRISPSERG